MTGTDTGWDLVASRVRQEREGLEWTQDDLADRAGLSRPTIQKIESGRSGGFNRSTVRRLESAFGWRPGSVDEIRRGGQPALGRGEIAPDSPVPPMYYVVQSLILECGQRQFMATVTQVLNDLGRDGRLPP